ncbi:MAG: hypothetical protein IPP48_07045 [Chitinophagaceae bacterium]|nr:hypothetical protein [Chitinophagaceae bacterium]
MENTQQPAEDLITTDEPVEINKLPLTLGIISISAFLLSFLTGYGFLPGLGIVLFGGAFVVSIIGVITARNYNRKYNNITAASKQKLMWAKTLSLVTLILSSLVILAAVSLLILIGVNGFGR